MAEIVVVGGGLVGSLIALGIAQTQREVTLIDRSRPQIRHGTLGMDIRNVAVSPASRELLEQVGVWADLHPAPYNAMQVWEERGTRAIEFRAREVGRDELGWIVQSSEVLCALWDALSQMSNVTLETGAAVEEVSVGGSCVVVRTADGDVRARLLIAADGAHSRVREALKVATRQTPTGHHALATVVRTEIGHHGVALQRFLIEGPLALLPGDDAHLSSVVWSQPPARAEQRLALTEEEFCAEIEGCLEARLGAVTAVDERFVFPLDQMLVESFNPVPRVLIVGDAARVLHPLAGLGANVGFEDARDLLDDLAAIPSGLDPGAPGRWRKFARQRRARSRMMLALMTGFRRAYAGSDPWSQWLRNTGVDWLNHAGPLKRQLIREALGLGPVARRW
ncbi:MAG: FAD-dependent monooxygenase [Gammaproteobacteria bacterium]|nr:FAD-dependent monooxygenase [Gammaproteobacteria bacterium]